MILSDVTIREELAAGRIVIDPLDGRARSSRRRSTCTSTATSGCSATTRRRSSTRSSPRRTSPSWSRCSDGEARSSSTPASSCSARTLERVALPDDLVGRLEGKSSLGPPRPADPQHRGLRRRRLGRTPHARAVERRQPADRALPGDEDRADLVPAHDDAGRAPVRQRRRPARSTRASAARRRRATT